MTHPMGPVCVGYTPGPPENQIPPYIGHDDLFRALKVELGHTYLIRNFSLMQWNMEVQPTSNYSLGWAYKTVSELGHADVHRDLSVKVWK